MPKKTKKTQPKKVAKPAAKKIVARKPAPAAKKLVSKIPIAPPSQARENSVEDYVSKVAPWQRAIIEKLREVVQSVTPHASESIKWGQPVYEHKGPFSYIKAHAAQVNFGFWRGAELDDPKRMLQGEGERMRHVKLLEAQPIDELSLGALVKQAYSLNEKKGDPTKG